VSEEEAIRWFYMQLLMGDSTDNIPGIPKVGPVKAAKALAEFDNELDYYTVCRKGYDEAYDDGLAALIENARLLWMRRQPHEWWQPPVEEDMDDA
jgi:5'-3' exonuclease